MAGQACRSESQRALLARSVGFVSHPTRRHGTLGQLLDRALQRLDFSSKGSEVSALLRSHLLERRHFCANLLSRKPGNFRFQDAFDVWHSDIMQMP